MACLALEGFEGFGTTNGDSGAATVAAEIAKKYVGTFLTGSDVRIYDGWGSGKAFSFGKDSSASSNFFRIFITEGDTYFIGFAMKTPTGQDTQTIVNFRNDPDTVNHVSLELRGNTGFRFLRGSTELAAVQNVIFPNRWYYIEVKVVINDTTGQVQLRVNGVEKINVSSLDTRNGGATATADNVTFIGVPGNSFDTPDDNYLIDDIYINDDAGSLNNSFAGPTKIEALYPDAEGDNIDFTPSTGTDNSALVDENPSNEDTDYNSSSIATNKDLFTMGNRAVVDSGIIAVQMNYDARVTDATTFDLIAKVKHSTSEGTGANQTISDTSYGNYSEVFETNPSTSAQWTASEIDAMQAGYELA